MWKYVRKTNPIWMLDATGKIHRKISKQPKPFYYSIVAHDTFSESIIPVAEFVTTANDQNNISIHLNEIKRKLQEATKTAILPKIIITDMSWALINAVLKVFNNCNMLTYLNWCYRKLFENEQSDLNILYYTCSTHFLKNIIRKTKKVTNATKVRRAFIFMLALIQNSTKIEEIDTYLFHIYRILKSKQLDGNVMKSLHIISTKLKGDDLDCCNFFERRSVEQRERDSLFKEFRATSEITNDEKSLRKQSPFQLYYEKKNKRILRVN